jgi:lipopolysaccharide transport system permease protein
MIGALRMHERGVISRRGKTILSPLSGLWIYRQLIWQLLKREVLSRYRGSVIGIAWSLLNPLLMLAVYTFVFSQVLKTRWPGNQQESMIEFAVMLFTGLIVYNLFAECINRAPGLILSNANYVKKVIFPLEVLPWVIMGSAAFNASTTTVVLLLGVWIFKGAIPVTALLMPLVIAPLVLTTIGFTLFLSAVGVFYRDLGQGIGLVTTMLLFMSPVFYPASALPQAYQSWVALNPLAYVIEDARKVLVKGQGIEWEWWTLQLVAGYAIAAFGYWWFQKTRKGFADVF